MIKDLKKLYVLNIIKPTIVFIGDNFKNEEVEILRNRICKKEMSEEENIIYRDLEMDFTFNVNEEIGSSRIDEKSIVPLSSYYNIFGIPKINFSNNTEKVRAKVRQLKKENRL